MKTYLATNEDVKRKWFIVDAKGKILGRLATHIASVLRGKHKTSFTPHVDCGDGVIVLNAKDVKVTGKKMEQKLYRKYTGYPGGLKEKNLGWMLQKKPTHVLKTAVEKMLPKNKIGDQMIKRLKVYADDKHPHLAQAPKELKIG